MAQDHSDPTEELEEAGAELLRPEPKPASDNSERGGFALFGLVLAVFALIAIYASSPVDLPEFPDCPIQSLGNCGHY